MQKFSDKVAGRLGDIASVISYTNAKTAAVVSCSAGHKWAIIPSNLLSRGNGAACPACNSNPQYTEIDGVLVFHKKKSSTAFEKELAKINSSVKLTIGYSDSHVPVSLECCVCKHTWQAIPTNILTRHQDARCSQCNPRASENKLTLEQASSKVKAKYPNLELLEYNGSGFECNVHDTMCGHSFTTWYSNIVQGKGYRCTTCVPEYGTSKNEKAILDFVCKQYSGWVEANDRTLIKPKELDILIPDLGIAIEYNSPYTHEDKDHLQKLNLVEAVGFRLIQVNEDEWNYKQDVVKNKLLALLGNNLKVAARKCTVERIGFPGEFLDANHLQGRGQPTSINYGLLLEGELVATMTFGTPRFNKAYDHELIRYCALGGITVVGGAGKLLAQWRRDYPGYSLLSYSDRRWSSGNLYQQLGFQHVTDTVPGYAYYKNRHKLSRYACQKHRLEALLPEYWNPELSEAQIMRNAGFYRMYDCGMGVWSYNV